MIGNSCDWSQGENVTGNSSAVIAPTNLIGRNVDWNLKGGSRSGGIWQTKKRKKSARRWRNHLVFPLPPPPPPPPPPLLPPFLFVLLFISTFCFIFPPPQNRNYYLLFLFLSLSFVWVFLPSFLFFISFDCWVCGVFFSSFYLFQEIQIFFKCGTLSRDTCRPNFNNNFCGGPPPSLTQ